MDNQGSDDYELVSKQEVDGLRQEIHSLKKNSLAEGEMGRVLLESVDRLTLSINRMIAILDDAQKDIIDEYQQSKPAEKLNKLLEQNQMIAKALVAISENFNAEKSKNAVSPNELQGSFPSMQNAGQQNMPFNPSFDGSPMNQPMQQPRQFSASNSSSFGGMNMSSSPTGISSMGPMDDLPPMDTVPPLDMPPPGVPKKKFLGIM